MTIRSTYVLGLIAVCFLLLTSVGLQVFAGILPCPLCTLQRLAFGVLAILFVTGIFYAKHWGRLIINALCCLTSITGMVLAGRQVWLQHFPPADSSECGVSLQYMLQVLPMNEVLTKVFSGSAECTQRGWEFLHLNMAEWALIWFIVFFVLTICLFLEEIKH